MTTQKKAVEENFPVDLFVFYYFVNCSLGFFPQFCVEQSKGMAKKNSHAH